MSSTVDELEFFAKRAYLSQEIEFNWPYVVEKGEVRPLKEGEKAKLKVLASRIPLQQMSDAGLRASTHGPLGSDAYNNYFMHYLGQHLGNALKDEGVKKAYNQMSNAERTLVLSSYLAAVQDDREKAEKNADT